MRRSGGELHRHPGLGARPATTSRARSPAMPWYEGPDPARASRGSRARGRAARGAVRDARPVGEPRGRHAAASPGMVVERPVRVGRRPVRVMPAGTPATLARVRSATRARHVGDRGPVGHAVLRGGGRLLARRRARLGRLRRRTWPTSSRRRSSGWPRRSWSPAANIGSSSPPRLRWRRSTRPNTRSTSTRSSRCRARRSS